MSRSDQIFQDDESFDQEILEKLKQQICLNNHQLLELTYNDQKFYKKLTELNHLGCQCITQEKYHQALIYLNQAEKILQYAASCGKTIQRTLIITTLNNEAALYQRAHEFQKAASYIEAIIYNISSFFEKDEPFSFTQKVLDSSSIQYQDFRIYLWRKNNLALYYLRFCAVNSQNRKHQNAYNSALKAVLLLKQISLECSKYERLFNQSKQVDLKQKVNAKNRRSILIQLTKLKGLEKDTTNIQIYFNQTISQIGLFLKKLIDTKDEQSVQFKRKFENYTISNLIHINLIQVQGHSDKVDLEIQISEIENIFKAIYLSIGYFIIATELRFISTEKYTLDENDRRNSEEYKQSQKYHLNALMIASKYLPCHSLYFEHISNSFRNHYKVDLIESANQFLENNPNFVHIDEQIIDVDEPEIEPVEDNNDELMNPIQNQKSQVNPHFDLKTEQSECIREEQIRFLNEEKMENEIPQSYNPLNNEKKNKKKEKQIEKQQRLNSNKKNLIGSKKNLKKSQTKFIQLNVQQKVKQNQALKNSEKVLKNILSSKSKQNQNILKSLSKRSKSKKKKKQFFQFNKKSPEKVDLNSPFSQMRKGIQNKSSLSKQINNPSNYNRDSEYIMAKSRSKSKRITTNIQQKLFKRKNDLVEIKKMKKVEEQYGIISKNSPRGIKTQNNSKKHQIKKSLEKSGKFSSTDLHIKKLKSPRNTKKKSNL